MAKLDGGRSVAERVVKSLRSDILKGAIKPGERLLETNLAARFQVSRGPIREALRRLAFEYLVEIEPRRGARVPELSRDEVDDLFETRGALFGVAATFAAARASDDQIQTICEEIRTMLKVAGNDTNAVALTARGTHAGDQIVRCARSPEVTLLMAEVVNSASRYYQVLAVTPVSERKEIRQAWSELASALNRRDSSAAGTAARRVVEIGRVQAMANLHKTVSEIA